MRPYIKLYGKLSASYISEQEFIVNIYRGHRQKRNTVPYAAMVEIGARLLVKLLVSVRDIHNIKPVDHFAGGI